MEGLDLEGDLCRWQVLLKVPYPYADDSRVSQKIKRNRWDWYYRQASTKIVQAAGRAVRSPQDWAEFYVLDECFDDVKSRSGFPSWFNGAITPLSPAVY